MLEEMEFAKETEEGIANYLAYIKEENIDNQIEDIYTLQEAYTEDTYTQL